MTTYAPTLMYDLANQNVTDRLREAEQYRLARETRRARRDRTTRSAGLSTAGTPWWRRLAAAGSRSSAADRTVEAQRDTESSRQDDVDVAA